MLLCASLALALAGSTLERTPVPRVGIADTTPAARAILPPAAPPDSQLATSTVTPTPQLPDTGHAALTDTIKPRQRPKAIDLSDWYYRRLEIHRWGSYAVIPLFAVQYIAGNQIFPDPANAPTWAKNTHRAGATLIAGVFTANTITGVWNLWETRDVPERRTLRYVHALSMLTADAAFTYAGAVLSTQAQNSLKKRQEHRTVALSAMGVTAVSALMMKLLNTRSSQ